MTRHNGMPCNSLGGAPGPTLFGRMSTFCPSWSWRAQTDFHFYGLYRKADTLVTTIFRNRLWCSLQRRCNTSSNWRIISIEDCWNRSSGNLRCSTSGMHHRLRPFKKGKRWRLILCTVAKHHLPLEYGDRPWTTTGNTFWFLLHPSMGQTRYLFLRLQAGHLYYLHYPTLAGPRVEHVCTTRCKRNNIRHNWQN